LTSPMCRTCCSVPNILFVAAMVAWVHPGLPPIGKSEDRGAVRVRSRGVFRDSKKRRAAAHPGLTPRSLGNRLLSGSGPVKKLLRCAKHLFVAAMLAGVHPANQNMNQRGSPRSKA
jgi:hypothetical protein